MVGCWVVLDQQLRLLQRGEMAAPVALASQLGIVNLHYLWLFLRGKAKTELFAPPEEIFVELVAASEAADQAGVLIDNSGRSFSNMWFIEYTEADRVDRGRVWSVAYTALFRDFASV